MRETVYRHTPFLWAKLCYEMGEELQEANPHTRKYLQTAYKEDSKGTGTHRKRTETAFTWNLTGYYIYIQNCQTTKLTMWFTENGFNCFYVTTTKDFLEVQNIASCLLYLQTILEIL
jgi:hypothetical protein